MPKRQENVSEHSESEWKLPRNRQRVRTSGVNMKKNETEAQMQGIPCELSKHLLELLNPMISIQNLPIQQRQNDLQNEIPHQDLSPSPAVTQQEPNLITFTPPQRQHEVHGATGRQSEPKK